MWCFYLFSKVGKTSIYKATDISMCFVSYISTPRTVAWKEERNLQVSGSREGWKTFRLKYETLGYCNTRK
jgi:hypothetical protein